MQLHIPAGTEISSGLVEIEFDVKYLCQYASGKPDQGKTSHGFKVYFRVGTALQASLVGTAPDFGEIGALSDFDVAGAPPSRTLRSHFLRVASPGPYQVQVVSQNGWRMTASGAPSGNPSERIGYRYALLGQTLDSGRPNFTPVRCEASGTAGVNIPMVATLTEGGQGPLALAAGDTTQCD